MSGASQASLRARAFDPLLILWIVLAAALIFLVVNPLFRLVQLSLEDTDTGAFTLMNYVTAYSRQRYLDRDLELAGTRLLGHRAVPDLRRARRLGGVAHRHAGKGAIRLLVLGAFVTPPYLGSIGWILLAGPNSGWLNRVWMSLTGAEQGLFNIYSFEGLAFNIALYSFPYLFIFTSAALDVVSSEMEDAANILGAGTLRTTLRITLPLVLPAILGGAIITFLEAIALFGTPALIAIPARFNVVTTQLLQFFSQPIRAEVAAAYAVPLLLITVALFGVQRWLVRTARLRLAHRQGRRSAADGARTVALGDARLHDAAAVAGGAAAVCRARAGGAGEGVGPRVQPRQSDAAQFPLPAVRARDRGAVGDQQLHLRRRGRLHRHGAGTGDRLHRQPRVCCRGPAS